MATPTNKATIGSISTGTLRNEDLLEAFANELERITGKAALPDEQVPFNEMDIDIQNDIILHLQDALNDYAPPFCYFGTLEGDGADFGFWPDHEAV